MFRYKGYTGKYLEVDLSTGSVEVLPIDEALAEAFLGGSGFGTNLLWRRVPAAVDPLSPDNLLIFATGPLNGTLMPNSGRMEMISKSPLTGIYGDSNTGGFLGPELKFAGFDMVVIRGKAPEPVYLWIEDGKAEIRSAKHLWGKDTVETEDALVEELHDPGVKVACIGPAGENLVRYACIQATSSRSFGRTGGGAVMGSKNLKAMAVRGFGAVRIADPDGFYRVAVRCHEGIKSNEIYPAVHRYGTPGIVSLMNVIGRFPTKNFQLGGYADADKINAEALRAGFFVKDIACFGCPVACDKIYRVNEGEYAGTTVRSFEYETINAFGANILNPKLDAILKASDICDRLGLDSITTGRCISFVMELLDRGILTRAGVDGLDLTWGNVEAAMELVRRIAYRQGVGTLLAEGVRRAAKEIGKGAADYAMDVKGQEIAAQDGRAQQSMGLAHVTSSRGADHLKAFPTIDETGYPTEARRRYGDAYLPDMADPRSTKYKGFLVKDGEDYAAVVDSTGTCKSGGNFVLAQIYWDDVAEAVRYATGMDIDVVGLKAAGERIVNLQRAYNAIHGISRKDDTLPKRFIVEPNYQATPEGAVCRLHEMLDDYYRLRGWDREGLPTAETLRRLGLEDTIPRLESELAGRPSRSP
ncbi:MAG: aldehyde ferredoxin oxidoreductase family protein [Firmicutes bacterium]|nr:aldehyde ferredoxin oxidoreductase family protein [Bacillota bacterium]